MTLFRVNCGRFFKYQKALVESLRPFQGLLALRFSSSFESTAEELKNSPERKILKVVIVGRPNAGKSTLINSILQLNVCGVSHKSHTTRAPFRAAFTRGDTQVLFLDTPGLVTQREYSRFNLTPGFLNWKERVVREADIIGIIHEVTEPTDIFKFHLNLSQNINDFPQSIPMFLVINKIDLVLDKDAFTAIVDSIYKPKNLERPDGVRMPPKLWQRFSQIFFTAALKNKGVDEVIDYLLEQAKPGQWIFEPGQVFEEPLDEIIRNLIRSHFLDILPNEIPYQCTYEVEYLKENDLGEFICVTVVTCRCKRHFHLITSGKKGSLRELSHQIESDLYKILGKVFRVRIYVQIKNYSWRFLLSILHSSSLLIGAQLGLPILGLA